MLDDLKFIHERDVQDALGIAEKQGQQLRHDFGVQWSEWPEILNVTLAGMGGSALAATIAQVWPGLAVPFEVVRDYRLPAYVGEKTLFIASSYSGNTEETLEALAAAEARGASIVVIASGGKLAAIAEEKQYPLYRLPQASQPRYAVLYGLTALVQLFASVGLVPETSVSELAGAGEWLSQQTSQWSPTVPTSANQAKQLAQELLGRSVVIYGSPLLWPAAYKWKISINENAKQVAWVNQLPEFNHNEFLGWTKQPVDKPYVVVDLRSNLEHERVQKRFAVTERLLSGLRPAPEVVVPEGDTLLQQLLWTIALGDFVSLYLALLNNLNPTPVELIEAFKRALSDG